MVLVLLSVTLFLSAFLLFWCQPMVARMLLPFLGGSASVWTTCVLFFQTTLLAGYVYAHGVARLVRPRHQMMLHGVLMLIAVLFLPIQFSADTSGAVEQPAAWLLLQLLGSAGVPFFVLSTTAPLLQSWLSQTKLESHRDPYFLYAASNAGSLLALMTYPFIVEPYLGVSAQSRLWAGGYGLLVLMVVSSAVLVSRFARQEWTAEDPAPLISTETRLYWLGAAFLPSAL